VYWFNNWVKKYGKDSLHLDTIYAYLCYLYTLYNDFLNPINESHNITTDNTANNTADITVDNTVDNTANNTADITVDNTVDNTKKQD
jgi:hypothetical protein